MRVKNEFILLDDFSHFWYSLYSSCLLVTLLLEQLFVDVSYVQKRVPVLFSISVRTKKGLEFSVACLSVMFFTVKSWNFVGLICLLFAGRFFFKNCSSGMPVPAPQPPWWRNDFNKRSFSLSFVSILLTV